MEGRSTAKLGDMILRLATQSPGIFGKQKATAPSARLAGVKMLCDGFESCLAEFTVHHGKKLSL